MKEQYGALRENFLSQNIEVSFFSSFDEARRALLNKIPPEDTVGIGNSQTLKAMELTTSLMDRGNIVYDKTLVTTPGEVKRMKRLSLLTDWYLSSANAVSTEGQIVNIDHSGNRVAAMAYGPERVIVIVGRNKVVDSLQGAIRRAKDHAAPRNAFRAGYRPPCVTTGRCVDCRSKERVCNHLHILEGQSEVDRLVLWIVDEEAGF
jgi:hypothetical protein